MANAVFCCGRMNPPTRGHLKLVRSMELFAQQTGAESFVFSTATHDGERNPLAWDEKHGFLERAFGREVLKATSPFHAIEALAEKGIGEAVFFVGEDRMERAEALLHFAATKFSMAAHPHVLTRPIDDVSATEVRQAAVLGDFEKFSSLVPEPDPSFSVELYHAIRRGMGVRDAFGEPSR